jgi:lipid II isoglutaminyl synthase (glutamine-hydrolysing)
VLQLRLPLPGLFNAYNVLGALAMAYTAFAMPAESMQAAIDQLPPVFGRAERLTLQGKSVRMLLIKNPVGATEVFRTVAADPNARLMLALNDKDADGRDVSWIWDAAFEQLPTQQPIVVSGLRANDLAIRLKYAGCPVSQLRVVPDIWAGLTAALEQTPDDATLYVLPSYTVLLNLNAMLEQFCFIPIPVLNSGCGSKERETQQGKRI